MDPSNDLKHFSKQQKRLFAVLTILATYVTIADREGKDENVPKETPDHSLFH